MKCTMLLHAVALHSRKKLPCFFLCCQLLTLTSCFNHFYKTNNTTGVDSDKLRELMNEKKYFILHTATQYFALSNVHLENDQLNADIGQLAPGHQQFLHPQADEHNRFKKKDKEIVMAEVHLYTHDSISAAHISMPVKNFYQVSVYNLDKESTNIATGMSIVGITVSAAIVAALVVAATNDNLLGFGGGFSVW